MLDSGLFKEVLHRPDDMESRLVFADWLEDQGNGMSEFIRLQLRLHALLEEAGLTLIYAKRRPESRLIEDDLSMRKIEMASDEIRRLFRQSNNLLAKHRRTWNGPVHRFLSERFISVSARQGVIRGWRYERGFIEHILVTLEGLANCSKEIFSLGPIRKVTLYRCDLTHRLVKRLVRDSRLAQVETFVIHQPSFQSTAAEREFAARFGEQKLFVYGPVNSRLDHRFQIIGESQIPSKSMLERVWDRFLSI